MSQLTAQRLTIAAEEYHARPELSHSNLKVLADSPRTFHAQFIAKTMPQKQSAEMRIGTLLHAAILEPDKFKSMFAIPPKEVLNADGHRKGAAYKLWQSSVGDREIISQDDADTIDAMAEALYASPASQWLRIPGENEVKLLWEFDGVPLRSMLDRLCENWIIDIKTTRHGGIREYQREAIRLRYFQQASFYIDAAQCADGRSRDFCQVVIESCKPHRVFQCEFSAELIDYGRNEYRKAIAKYKECMASGCWSDDHERETTIISLPHYLGEVKLEGLEDG